MKILINYFSQKEFISIYKKIIYTSIIFIVVFFISQFINPNFASASVIYQRDKTGSVLDIFRGNTMDSTNLWKAYFPAGITSITPPGNQMSLVNTPGIDVTADIRYIKVSNAGGKCSNIGYPTSGPIIYYRDPANTFITYHIDKFASSDGGLTCTAHVLPVIPIGSKIAALYFMGKYSNTNFLHGSVNQGGQTIDGWLQSKYIKDGGIAFKLCDVGGCDNEWDNEIVLEKKITVFNFSGLTPNVNGVIDEVNHTITLNLPFGTDVKALIPTITISSDTSVNPNSDTPQDFSTPVTYTVTAADTSTETYTVSVVIDPPIHDPVILIPGITGTYLNRNYGDKDEIWPDIVKLISPLEPSDSYLDDLALNEDGTENPEFPIVPGDIIRGISTVHVFDKLIDDFTNAGYIEGNDLFVFPYDWRLSTKSTADLLQVKIDQVLAYTGKEKVDIVAHSMGGLVAKKYIANDGKNKVDQLIFLGTPQLGSPKAFKTLMFGDRMGYKFLILGLNQLRAKYISQNMPSVYELLPSSKYIQENGNYIVDAFNELIGVESVSLDYIATKNLMIDKGRNSLMFPFAEELHDSIDNLDLSDMKSYNFVGCGSKTIGEIKVKQKRGWNKLFLGLKDDFDLKYINGDETVPVASAIKTIGPELYYAKNISHGDLPSADGVKENILAILTGKDKVESSNLVSDLSTCSVSGNVISTHSPVDLHIYDEFGNHTGFDANGDIEYGVPGVQYDVLDEVKYAFLPEGVNYKIVTKAIDIGGYNFKIEEQSKDDVITNTYKWDLIPLSTLQTTGDIWVGPDYSPTQYEVKIDKEGDGVIDNNYEVAYDGTSNAEQIISESLNINKNHSSGYMRLLPYQNIETVVPEQIIIKSDEIVEKQPEVSSIKLESIEEKVIVENEIKVEEKLEIKEEQKTETKGEEKYENNNLASVASTNIKISNNTLLIIIGGSILVVLLAIKFIFKLK